MDVVYTKIGKLGGVKSIEGANTLIDGKCLFAQIYWNGEDFEWKDEDLSNLIDGEKMFQSNTTLISFDDNLQNLVTGGSMFSGCEKLTVFNSELKNLLSGVNMFARCKLDDTSLENITTNINDIKDMDKTTNELWNYTIHNSVRNIDMIDRGRIYIGCDETIPEEKLIDYTVRLYKKGWEVLFNGNNYMPVRVWVDFNEYGELKAADLSGLVDGRYMFSYTNVGQITNEDGTVQSVPFDYNLPNLTDGQNMFRYCDNLTTFTADLPSLTNGDRMFYSCSNLTTFSAQLPSLTDGDSMFEGCENLTSFISNSSSLVDGYSMFQGCKNLKSFSSNLGSLKSGYMMFYNCKLDAESLRNIAYNINDIYDLDKNKDEDWEKPGTILTIYKPYRGRIDIYLDSSVTEEVKNECGDILFEKGWEEVYFNGKKFTN